GRAAKGEKDFVACHGQRLAVLPGDYDEVLVAGASTEGDEAGALELEDGAGKRTRHRLWLSDWTTGAPGRDEAVLATLSHRHTPGGDEGSLPRVLVARVALAARAHVAAL